MLVVAAGGAAAWWFLPSAKPKSSKAATTTAVPKGKAPVVAAGVLLPAAWNVVDRPAGELTAPLQNAVGAGLTGGRLLLAGGLTAADTSTAAILVAMGGTDRVVGQLPVAVHDAAAVKLGADVFLFGGGDGTTQHDEIVRIDPATGRTSSAGRLPAPSSDQAAAGVGAYAYVVGGYTGTAWLDTVVRWRPGKPAQVIAHLPTALRYAAVTAVGNSLVVAGGSLPNGTASSAVYSVSLPAGKVRLLGRLPAPTTHAAAATVRGEAMIIGGRSATLDTPTSRIVSVNPVTGLIRVAGSLRVARSDLFAAAVDGRILLAGGHSPAGTVATLDSLVPVAAPRRRAAARLTANGPAIDIYSHDRAGMLAPAARAALPRVYVPTRDGFVEVIDPRTFKIVDRFAAGALPQHVVPAYDLKTLYVTNDVGNSLTPINPRTAKPGKSISVEDPYNMYFTPGGRYAIVVAERLALLDFRDAHTFRLHHSLSVPCLGVDHIDFSADGRYLLASCEFSGQLVKVDVAKEKVVGVLTLPHGREDMPQDVKLSPDGSTFYVADMAVAGVWQIDGRHLRVTGFVPTGLGAHGLYVSRNTKDLYVTNRSAGSISVISFATGKVVKTWQLPGGGSPDMGNVSADGKVLWLSGRYNAVVYAISTANGKLLAKIPVGPGPHGLAVWPEPGRYSLGHTGILR